jgi:hypothetical protein
MLGAVLAVAVLAYAFVVLAFYALQARLIYFPQAALDGSPGDAGLHYEELRFAAADGVSLHGWWIPARASRGALLFMHGNAGNISHRLQSIRLFHELGLDVLIFDYRGYGRSAGRPSEGGTYLDARAAWDALLARGTPPERVIVFGRSLGGAIACALATEVTPAAVIIESTFTSVPDLAAELYPWLPARALARFSYDTRARLARLRRPLLIVHSEDDELVPHAHAEALYAAANEPKRLLVIRGSHGDGFLASGDLYRQGVNDFLAGVL